MAEAVDPNCTTHRQVVAEVTQRFQAEVAADLRGERAQALLDLFRTHTDAPIVADSVLVFTRRGASTALIVTFLDGCRVGSGTAPLGALQGFISWRLIVPDDGRRQGA